MTQQDWDTIRCPVHGDRMIPYVRSDNVLEVRCPHACNETGPIPVGLLEHINEQYQATPGGWPEIVAPAESYQVQEGHE